jgi:hypothetical protein
MYLYGMRACRSAMLCMDYSWMRSWWLFPIIGMVLIGLPYLCFVNCVHERRIDRYRSQSRAVQPLPTI